MRKILITGGAGFIGSNLALKLLDCGHEVTVLDNLSEQIHGANPEVTSPLYASINGKVNFIKGSVNSKIDLLNAIMDCEVIIHLAAETGTGQSMYQVERYANVNILGTALLLDILINCKHSIRKLIVASSRSVYGEGKYLSDELGIVYPEHRTSANMDRGDFEVKFPNCYLPLKCLPTDEDSKLHPSSVYGITKLNQEQLVATVCKSIGIPSVVLRFQNVYGPGQTLANPYTGILSIFSTQIKNHDIINIFEDGKESRDFVFIDDVVDAIVLGVENKNADFEIFNVGTGVPIDVYQVAQMLMKYYDIEVPINVSGNYRLGDIRHNYADLTKISSLLNYTPTISFEEGIRRFTAWVNTQEVQENKYSKSFTEMKLKGLLK